MAERDFDVVIIGAGISGLNAAYRLQEKCPSLTYTILETRDDLGGTWDLFKYPGIRSDSDLHTFGFAWRPWVDSNPIAEAGSIKRYLKTSIAQYDIDKKISFLTRVDSANWSTETSTWTLDTTQLKHLGEETSKQIRCHWVVFATGYYDYYNPIKPDIPGLDNFKGTVIHPQFWPKDLDFKDKKMVIVGSGATAVTIFPVVASEVKEVTMLQRSPGYILSMPQHDPMVGYMKKILPLSWVLYIQRIKFLWTATLLYHFCQTFPSLSKRLIQKSTRMQLPKNYATFHPDFAPRYNPWDQRLCICPDGDFFRALRRNPTSARVITSTIKDVTEDGIQLSDDAPREKKFLPADIIVTATGLRLGFAGRIEMAVDGVPVDLGKRKLWKSTLIEGVPNAAFSLGYINNSWTLGADCAAMIVTRMLNYLSASGKTSATPRLPASTTMHDKPLLDLNSTYVTKAEGSIPKAGDKGPWRARGTYFMDMLSATWGRLGNDVVFA